MSVWDQFPPVVAYADVFRFAVVGDQIDGVIMEVRATDAASSMSGTSDPILDLRLQDGSRRTVFASNVQLRARLQELRPNPGDRVRITYVGVRNRMKLFEVECRRA